MPGDDAVRARLQGQLAELDAQVAHIEAERRAPLEPDFEEQAVAIESDEPLAGIEQAALDHAAQIRLALERIDSGTYGRCVDCGEAIAPARLAVFPAATRCVACAR